MMSTKSRYQCPICKNEIVLSPKQVKETPICSECKTEMALVRQGVLTK